MVLVIWDKTFGQGGSGDKLPDFDRRVILPEKNSGLSEERLRLLVGAMGSCLGDDDPKSTQVTNMLIRETVKFRNKLKEETGEILTVGDTQTALGALERHLDGRRIPRALTPEQKALTQIWIDRMTLFGAE